MPNPSGEPRYRITGDPDTAEIVSEAEAARRAQRNRILSREARAEPPAEVAFILARIIEDEREIDNDPPVGMGYARLPVRMRRECEVKRELLYAAVSVDQWETDLDGITMAQKIIAHLAQCWRDHPEYREEWRI